VKTLLRVGAPLVAVWLVREYAAYRDSLRLAATAPDVAAAHGAMELFQRLAVFHGQRAEHYGRKAMAAELRYRELIA